MGFQISGSVTPFNQIGGAKQNRETFSTMMTAAKSGDIEAAKNAFKEFTANRKPPPDSPLAKLGAAIESGDAATINDAAQALQKARKGPKRPEAAPSISTVQPAVTPDSGSATKSVRSVGTPPSISTVQPAVTPETSKSARGIVSPPSISTVQPVGTVEDVPLINVAQRRESPPLISTAQDAGTLGAGYSVNILV